MLAPGDDAYRSNLVSDGYLPRPASLDGEKMYVRVVGRRAVATNVGEPTVDGELRIARRLPDEPELVAEHALAPWGIHDQTRVKAEARLTYFHRHPGGLVRPI